MKKDTALVKSLKSSFLSCEKDTEAILRKLFIESRPYSDDLKRLLIISAKDCLDEEKKYKDIIDNFSIKKLIDDQYIKLNPKIRFFENEDIKSYIIITFDNFTPNESNPEYRDCTISFDIICHTDYWDIGNYRQRPIKIAGYIDSLLNECKLSGIGTLNFLGCNEIILDENLSGYTIMYRAVHGNDDKVELEE